MRNLLLTARLLWFTYGLFLWIFWLASVPLFLQRAAAGTLPTVVIVGLSAAEMARTGAASWGLSVAGWSWINTAVNGFSFLVFSLVAFLIWWRVPTGFGVLTAFVLLVGGSAFMNMAVYSAELSQTAVVAWEVGAVIWPLLFLWLYLFPNGRAVPRSLLWILGPLLVAFASLFLFYTTTIFIDNSALVQFVDRLQPYIETLALPLFLLAVGAQAFRYAKVSDESERKQTRWFIFGLITAFAPSFLLKLFFDYPAELDTLFFTALPIGIGISILRYRLWDIDVIIRKTLLYTVLSGVLGLIYFGSIILLQTVFEATTQERSPLIIVVSTLLIAALFAPLRNRVQQFIDHRFFRKKYDAQQVLAQFAQTARDKVDMAVLQAEFTNVVQETLQPETVLIWLKR